MGALGNLDHERFCQAAHKRIWGGEQRAEALRAAYLETIYSGDNPENPSVGDNSRKLANQKPVKARLAELAEYAAKLASIDASWGLIELKQELDAIRAFNLDDFLSAPDERGRRYIDFTKVPRERLALLTEVTTKDTKYGAEIKIKGPNRYSDKVGIITLMAKIAGWFAPEKQEHSGQLTLEQIVMQSLKPTNPEKPAPVEKPQSSWI